MKRKIRIKKKKHSTCIAAVTNLHIPKSYFNPPASLLFAGRVAEEQLHELTRLVLRLPEVDALLQRAGLQHAVARPEPAAALEMFVKAGWSPAGQHSSCTSAYSSGGNRVFRH